MCPCRLATARCRTFRLPPPASGAGGLSLSRRGSVAAIPHRAASAERITGPSGMDQEKVAFSQQVEVDPGRTGSASPAQPARGSRARESAPGRERRVLVVAPEPFYEDRGTPIAIRRVLGAL